MLQKAHVFAIPAGHRFRRHEHEGPHLCAVVRGGFSERAGGSWTEVSAGTARYSGSARHDIDFGSAGATCLLLSPAIDDLPSVSSPRFLDRDPWIAELVSRLAAALAGDASAAPLGIDGLATELWAQVQRRVDGRTTAPPSWLRRVPGLVRDAEGRIPVSALADEVRVHRVHLARAFREHYGLSVTEYGQRVRVMRARDLLLHGREPLADVAMAAGFADQSHMTRAVRAAFGVTPAALRGALHPFKTGPLRDR
jgi:AraC family transcriptional regulator